MTTATRQMRTSLEPISWSGMAARRRGHDQPPADAREGYTELAAAETAIRDRKRIPREGQMVRESRQGSASRNYYGDGAEGPGLAGSRLSRHYGTGQIRNVRSGQYRAAMSEAWP
jgi:hypothetical protein